MPMAKYIHGDPRDQVEIALAVLIPNVTSLATRQYDWLALKRGHVDFVLQSHQRIRLAYLYHADAPLAIP